MAEITSETRAYELGADQVNYFEVHTVVYSNGESDVKKRLIGASAALTAFVSQSIETEAADITADARNAARLGKRLDVLVQDAQTVGGITGTSPLEAIRDKYSDTILQAGWMINDGSGPAALSFTINAQGLIRYSVAGSQARTAILFGAALRLLNYPTSGINTDFFTAPGNRRLFSLPDAKIIIQRP